MAWIRRTVRPKPGNNSQGVTVPGFGTQVERHRIDPLPLASCIWARRIQAPAGYRCFCGLLDVLSAYLGSNNSSTGN